MKSKVYFPSKDTLLITADYYPVEKPKGYILLCHRSHCNRGEYQYTAPKLNELWFSCLALDQRSGMKIFGHSNETKDRAKIQGLPTGYNDAQPDIEAGIDYLFELAKMPIILFGSSYSASLVLILWKQNPKVESIIAFSPWEYLKWVNVTQEIHWIQKPTFVTSAKKEAPAIERLVQGIDKKYLTHYRPMLEGFHGSKALWQEVLWHEEYWGALEKFLAKS